MATYFVTVNNSLNVFGPQDTNRWNEITWGVDLWGYGQDDLRTLVAKPIEEALSLASEISTVLIYFKTLSNTLSLDVDMFDESLIEENGYYRVFGVTGNNETRPLTSYNETSDITTSYTTAADVTTSYTQIN